MTITPEYMEEISEKIYSECIFVEAGYDIEENNVRYLLQGAINTLGLTKKGYNKFEDICENTEIKTNNYHLTVGYDVSGYNYWTVEQEETNYVDFNIEILNPLTDEDLKNIKEANRRLLQQLDDISSTYGLATGTLGYND